MNFFFSPGEGELFELVWGMKGGPLGCSLVVLVILVLVEAVKEEEEGGGS